MAEGSTINVHLYDGSRKLLAPGQDFLLTTRAGGNAQFVSKFFTTNPTPVAVKFHDNADDNYTVLASLKQYEDAGYVPIPVKKNGDHSVFLMLIPRNAQFNFAKASWEALERDRPQIFRFLSTDPNGKANYSELKEQLQSRPSACLLNICAAVESLGLLDHFKSIDLIFQPDPAVKEGVRPDRFYAYVNPALPGILAQKKKLFEKADFSLHGPTASDSYKEIRFDEANLQFTFHGFAPSRRVGDEDCIKIEMDVDFYKDKGAHFFLEVIPNTAARKLHFGPGLTDPRVVYALRWMAGKNAGEDFDPLYEIA